MKTAMRLASFLILGVVGSFFLLGIAQVEAGCEIADVSEGPPLRVQFRIQENGGTIYGLEGIGVVEAVNASVNIPTFPIGTPFAVTVTATRINPNMDFRVVLEYTNTLGNSDRCSYSRPATPTNEPPVCSVSSENPGPPLSVVFTVRDSDTGLQSITVLEASNADVDIPDFSVGYTGPVQGTATRVNENADMRVVLLATDTAGAESACNYSVNAALDETPPVCGIVSTIPGPPTQVLFEVQDLESGLASVDVTEVSNATVSITPFVPGTIDPVGITVTQINTSLQFSAAIEATDFQDNASRCRYPQIVYDINRPEFDAAGDDSENFFRDALMGRIIDFSRDSTYARINDDSDFSSTEYFSTNAGDVVPDPCYSTGSDTFFSALTTSWSEATYEWEIVLQMQPANDIWLAAYGCVLSSGASDILEDGRQTGMYRTPWAPNQLVFLMEANPKITVRALPGPNAEQGFPVGGFSLDARQLPGLELVSLVESPFPVQAFINHGILMVNPRQGASNSAGETMYTLHSGDRIRITVHIPPNNTADIRFGQDSVLLRYLGIVGTEFSAGN
ncbi:hypothetical protein DSCA_47280 [Desulfosarcina alkanivorans]|uniref:Uncharacterized protein n=2 Tax=Desulfosarcina alkanivorans TaxID=571177 RepID=A0A5K7YPY9_9BACT|nr:hypothetical protein DSCA_47280 [Desulfosarcina alkanivorans]